MVQGSPAPGTHVVGIGPMRQEPRHRFVIGPVQLAMEHGGKACGCQLAALHEDLQGIVVAVGFRSVIGHLAVVGVRAAVDQQARQLRVVGHGGRAVQHALPGAIGLVALLVPAGIGTGAGVEQGRRRADEAFRPRALEPQVSGEAEMGERIPAAWSSLGRHALAGSEPPETRARPFASPRMAAVWMS